MLYLYLILLIKLFCITYQRPLSHFLLQVLPRHTSFDVLDSVIFWVNFANIKFLHILPGVITKLLDWSGRFAFLLFSCALPRSEINIWIVGRSSDAHRFGIVKWMVLIFKWLFYVPPGSTFTNSTFCPHSVFKCFAWISEKKTAIISLHSINWLVFIIEMECVYCAVRTGYLYIILRSAYTVYLCFLCGSENKQRLFPYTALTDRFL